MSEQCQMPQGHPTHCGCQQPDRYQSSDYCKAIESERDYLRQRVKALHAEAEALRAENEKWRRRAESARGLIRYPCKMWDGEEAESQEYSKGYNMALEHVENLNATPAPEVPDHLRDSAKMVEPGVQAEQEKCDRDLELFGVSFSVRGRRVDPADVVWRMKHAYLGPEVSRYDDFRGDNKWLVSSASSLLALDEKGALTGGGIGGHARTIIASLAARLMQQEDRQQSSRAEQGERQEAVARVGMVPGTDFKSLDFFNTDLQELPVGTMLYTTPQPSPYVRWLAAFALELIDGAWEGGSFDGGDIQEAGVRHGLLTVEQRQESCGEHCDCAEHGFPAECYRLTPALAAHRQAQQGGSHD